MWPLSRYAVPEILHRVRKMLLAKPRDGIVIRRTMPFQQIHEIYILTAGTFNFPCLVNPTGATVKNDFEKQTW